MDDLKARLAALFRHLAAALQQRQGDGPRLAEQFRKVLDLLLAQYRRRGAEQYAGRGVVARFPALMTALVLRRVNVSRISGSRQDDDFDVFDGERDVGRIYLVDDNGDPEMCFWGASLRPADARRWGCFSRQRSIA
jgi:hypothetical protein